MRDTRILRICPFCGEAEYLRVHELSIERPIVQGDDTLKDDTGAEITEEVDSVGCNVCEAMAPLDVWNGQRSAADYRVLRGFDDGPEAVAA